ncbi:MAG: hypothetical protein DRN49_01620, partial [Thaumarchaeota archaeon]
MSSLCEGEKEMPRKKGDYRRVEEELRRIEEDIEFEYGKPFDELSYSEKKQVLLDHFFHGLPEYKESARDM